jgi:ATP-dependent Clp protease ATP-binding subunit ClpB
MTSNLRGDPLNTFKPEFVNRIDEIVRFRQLGREDLFAIVGIQIADLKRRLEARRICLEVTPEAEMWLGDHGYDPDFGARPLRRVIQREIGDPLAIALLEGRYSDGGTVRVEVEGDKLVLA